MSIHGDRAYAALYAGVQLRAVGGGGLCPELGMSEEQVLRLASGFGAGVGRLREVCGAFGGVVLVLGALYGNTDPAGKTAPTPACRSWPRATKPATVAAASSAARLLGLKQAEGSPVASARTAEYYKKRPCPQLVRLAAEIMEEYIAENPPLPPEKSV